MKFLHLICAATLLVSALAQAGSDRSADEQTVRAKEYAFAVRIPSGWTLEGHEPSAVNAHRRDAHPANSDAPYAILTAIGAIRPFGPDVAFADVIAQDIKEQLQRGKRKSALLGPETLAPIALADGRHATVIRYQIAADDSIHAVAGIEEADSINLIILDVHGETSFKADYPDFVRVVRSYRALPMPPSTRPKTVPAVW